MIAKEKIQMIIDSHYDYYLENIEIQSLNKVVLKYPQLGSILDYFVVPLRTSKRTFCAVKEQHDREQDYANWLSMFMGWTEYPEDYEQDMNITVKYLDETHYLMTTEDAEVEFFLTSPLKKDKEVYTIIYDPRGCYGVFDLNLLTDLFKNNPSLGSFKDYCMITMFEHTCFVKTEEFNKVTIDDYEEFLNYALNLNDPDFEDEIIDVEEFDSDHYQIEINDALIDVYEITPKF